MKSKVCHLVGAGDFFGFNTQISPDDTVIAVDGGYRILNDKGIVPDYVVGDFDSLGIVPDGENVTVLPSEKDVTDMFTAINLGIEKGCVWFHIYGGTGGRLDHTLANFQLLRYFAEKGVTLMIYGDGFVLTAVRNGGITLFGEKGSYVSVFSLTDASEGVCLKNLKYELENYTLTSLFPLGVSNEFTDKAAEISVGNGVLAVYYPIGKD
ncbi:MAG: thiamine diphosphokinase [Ruminiclostridium sp.]|nr:thiamine diphosphokinase [Ruminiclostridium sp.]